MNFLDETGLARFKEKLEAKWQLKIDAITNAGYITGDDSRLSDARPADGGTSDYANVLNATGGIAYGENKLQFYDTSADAGNDPTAICNPTSAWWYHVILNHENPDGYYFDTAYSFFDDDIRYRRITGGEDNGWVRVIDEKNISSYLPTSLPASDVYSWAKESAKPSYTKSEVGLGNVENKSSATIRGELTKSNVTDALGFTPVDAAEFTVATSEKNGLMSKEDKAKMDRFDELASKEVEISVDNKSIVKSNENIISCNAVSDTDIENLFAGSSIEPIIFSNDYYKKTETYSKDEVDEIVGDINSVLEAIV